MKLNSFIDYTLLKPQATETQMINLCETAAEHNFATVCLPPVYVSLAKEFLFQMQSNVKVCTVIGFPFGYSNTISKINEIEQAVYSGADELDVVANISWIKSGKWDAVYQELKQVISATKELEARSKIIIESGALTMEEVERICKMCIMFQPDFVKTSTGYYEIGAELSKVEKMRSVLPDGIQIKASGGIKTLEQATEFIQAGATRIGTSSLFI